jgi:WD40 repeat protein
MSNTPFSLSEYCDRIKYEYELLQSVHNVSKMEFEKIQAEKKELKVQAKRLYDTAYYMNLQIHKQEEINNRLLKIIEEMKGFVPNEHMGAIDEKLDVVSEVSIEDIERHIKSTSTRSDYSRDLVSEPKRKRNEPKLVVSEPHEEDRMMLVSPSTIALDIDTKLLSDHFKGYPLPKEVRLMATLHHDQMVPAVAITKDGSKIYTGCAGVVNLWKYSETNIPLKPYATYTSISNGTSIRSFAFSGDEKTLAMCGETKEVAVWNIERETPSILQMMETFSPFHYTISLTKDGKYLFAGMNDGKIAMWNVADGKLVKSFIGHTESVAQVLLSQDESVLYSGSTDQTVRVWDIAAGKETAVNTFGQRVFSIGMIPNVPSKFGELMTVGTQNGATHVLNLNTGEKEQYSVHQRIVFAMKHSHTGSFLVTASHDSTLAFSRNPYGPCFIRKDEKNMVLGVDMDALSSTIVTGSYGSHSSVYKAIY